MADHPLNLALRFLLELVALAGLGYWGLRQGEGPARWPAAVGLPLLAVLLWGTFRVPDDPVPAPAVPYAWARRHRSMRPLGQPRDGPAASGGKWRKSRIPLLAFRLR